MFKGRFGAAWTRQGSNDYSYLGKEGGLNGGGGGSHGTNSHAHDGDLSSTWRGRVLEQYAWLSRLPLWRILLPVIVALFSLSVFINSVVYSYKYFRASGIYVPNYKTIPVISQAQIDAGKRRQITMDQCLANYPGLFEEADRSAEYWQRRGGVSMDQLDKAADRGQTARVLIYNGEMYVKRFEWERHSRTRAELYLINEAIITSVEPIPNIEFVIHTDDKGETEADKLPIWVLDRKPEQTNLWLMPDYGFNSWPEPKVGSYSEVVRKAHEYDARTTWEDKVPQLFWKGAFLTDVRKNLARLAQDFSWAKIEEVDWRNKNTVVTMDDHCGYKYLGHLEGWAYSGRLKYILQCKSVVVAHEMEYVQHFHHLINSTMGSPHQNMVVIPGMDWKDLPVTMEYLIDNDAFAEELAERQRTFWGHYISKQSVDCYWRYMFNKWAEIQTFTPELHYEDTPYESFNLIGRTHWDPY